MPTMTKGHLTKSPATQARGQHENKKRYVSAVEECTKTEKDMCPLRYPINKQKTETGTRIILSVHY